MDVGLNGLEVYYRSYELPVVERLRKVATELRLVKTGGTDFHGDRETYAEAHAQLWLPDGVEAPFRAALAGRRWTGSARARIRRLSISTKTEKPIAK